jgi:hypothetical protein
MHGGQPLADQALEPPKQRGEPCRGDIGALDGELQDEEEQEKHGREGGQASCQEAVKPSIASAFDAFLYDGRGGDAFGGACQSMGQNVSRQFLRRVSLGGRKVGGQEVVGYEAQLLFRVL